MSKHAYLILAHQQDYTLKTLIKLLDDKRNDIFLHMDAKCSEYNLQELKKLISYSTFCSIPRCIVNWGSFSMVEAELNLLKASTTSHEKYDYYHLLSGEDLPLKSPSYIHKFFNENSGKEFVRFNHQIFKYQNRVNYYYILQKKLNPRSYNI